jgi:hypothetical protein
MLHTPSIRVLAPALFVSFHDGRQTGARGFDPAALLSILALRNFPVASALQSWRALYVPVLAARLEKG